MYYSSRDGHSRSIRSCYLLYRKTIGDRWFMLSRFFDGDAECQCLRTVTGCAIRPVDGANSTRWACMGRPFIGNLYETLRRRTAMSDQKTLKESLLRRFA
jgi:hypothetical protein